MDRTPRSKSRQLDRVLGVVAIVTIVIAWFIGYYRASAAVEPVLGKLLPEASRFSALGNSSYAAYRPSAATPFAYVAVGEATGYGGPMRVAVAVDPQGQVLGLVVVEHKETPAWIDKVTRRSFFKSLLGKSYRDAFVLGEDVDGITGATYTSRAIADSVAQAARSVAREQLGLPVAAAAPPKIQWGIPEITVVLLFAVGYFGHQPKFKHKNLARWGAMLTGLVVLGFVYNRPLAIAFINQLLLGYWPAWQTDLYWYLLIGGVLFVFTVDNKNPYCEWFCPFGAAQECMGLLGGARTRSAGRAKDLLAWLQRGLAWLAIVLALVFRNPGLSSYEIFGTLFSFTGSAAQFALLGIVLIAALFIKRPWCAYLCPLKPVMDLYRTFRKWVWETWQTRRIVPGR